MVIFMAYHFHFPSLALLWWALLVVRQPDDGPLRKAPEVLSSSRFRLYGGDLGVLKGTSMNAAVGWRL